LTQRKTRADRFVTLRARGEGLIGVSAPHRALGSETDAQKALQDGLVRNPRAAVLEHALGPLFARQKRTTESVQALRAAARLEPDNFHFAYVYAVALNDSGQPASLAMYTLQRARDHLRT
jgi:predicted Zn-dependent protease